MSARRNSSSASGRPRRVRADPSQSGRGRGGRGKGGFKRTNVPGHVRVEAAEDEVAVGKLGGAALAHHHGGDGVAHGPGLLPPHRLAVRPAGGAGRGPDGVQPQQRVPREQQHEALPDGAGAAEDACGSSRHVSAVQDHDLASPPLPLPRCPPHSGRWRRRTALLGGRLRSHGEPIRAASRQRSGGLKAASEGRPTVQGAARCRAGRGPKSSVVAPRRDAGEGSAGPTATGPAICIFTARLNSTLLTEYLRKQRPPSRLTDGSPSIPWSGHSYRRRVQGFKADSVHSSDRDRTCQIRVAFVQCLRRATYSHCVPPTASWPNSGPELCAAQKKMPPTPRYTYVSQCSRARPSNLMMTRNRRTGILVDERLTAQVRRRPGIRRRRAGTAQRWPRPQPWS